MLPRVAETALERLSRTLQESSTLAVLDGTEAVYIARIPAPRRVQVVLPVGTRVPAYATSTGCVLLVGLSPDARDAYFDAVRLEPLKPETEVREHRLRTMLDEIAERGWCAVRGEFDNGMHAVSVPARDRAARTIAAVNVSLHAKDYSGEDLIRDVTGHGGRGERDRGIDAVSRGALVRE